MPELQIVSNLAGALLLRASISLSVERTPSGDTVFSKRRERPTADGNNRSGADIFIA